jgi:hypothetical protein
LTKVSDNENTDKRLYLFDYKCSIANFNQLAEHLFSTENEEQLYNTFFIQPEKNLLLKELNLYKHMLILPYYNYLKSIYLLEFNALNHIKNLITNIDFKYKVEHILEINNLMSNITQGMEFIEQQLNKNLISIKNNNIR